MTIFDNKRTIAAIFIIYLAAIPFSIGLGDLLLGVHSGMGVLYEIDTILDPIGGVGPSFTALGLSMAIFASFITGKNSNKENYWMLSMGA